MSDLTVVKHEPESHRMSDRFRHYLGDIMLGANDGIITTFAVVSGVAGADLSAAVVLIMGAANLLADGFSMGASNYLAIRSSAGAHGSNRGIREPLLHAAVTFWAFVVIGFVPLVGYVLPFEAGHKFWFSCFSSALALFGVGSARALVTSRGWFRCGIEMLLIGLTAAAFGYGAGWAVAGWVR